MKLKNISTPYRQFFAFLAIPAIALFFMAFSGKAVMNRESPDETIPDTIITSIMDKAQLKIKTTKDPLILVDGEEVPDMKSLNPADIESISILKSAKATDIFAAKGKNGVILITTKKETNLYDKSKLLQLDNSLLYFNKINIHRLYNSTDNPLYLIDGKEVPTIENINPDNIQSISILKNQSATSIFGEKAKNGVIMLKTKGGTCSADHNCDGEK